MGADGIHVGQDDLSVAEARARAGEGVIVGKSTHALDQAIAAEKEGADYIGVGPIYATHDQARLHPRRPRAHRPGPRRRPRAAILHRRHQREARLPEVIAAGAQRVVIVSDLLQSADIPAYCRRVRDQLTLLITVRA